MKQKIFDFLSSYGLMVLGAILIFSATISFKAGNYPVFKFEAARSEDSMPIIADGGDKEQKKFPISRPVAPLAKDDSVFGAKLSARSALVVDDPTGTVLYSLNAEQPRSLASVTKLMSMLVLSDLPMNWSSTTVILNSDLDGSSHHILAGEEYSLEDLWHVALVGSSNSAVRALVRSSQLAIDDFVSLMNKKSAILGLESARFVEPTGLDPDNFASALDVAKLLNAALKNKKIAAALQIGEYYARPLDGKKARRVWSTNWLLTNWVPNDFSADSIVGKTGYINDSGYNFAVWLKDNSGHSARAVILGADSNETRFSEARDLVIWAFGHYLWPGDTGYDQLAE